MTSFRIGTGYDIHPLVAGRPMMVGTVEVPHSSGPAGHSDGDVLVHALIDAVLGAAGLGDIGHHFPASGERWRDATGTDLLTRTMALVGEAGYHVVNVDATVILERPRLAPYLPAAAQTLAALMGVPVERVNLKAKTNEGLDAIGEGRAMAAHAAALLAC